MLYFLGAVFVLTMLLFALKVLLRPKGKKSFRVSTQDLYPFETSSHLIILFPLLIITVLLVVLITFYLRENYSEQWPYGANDIWPLFLSLGVYIGSRLKKRN